MTAVLARHSPATAEKFIQEVCWRTYWKGWLAMRPGLIARFNQERIALNARLAVDPDLTAAVAVAKAGSTGLACFDAWVSELVTTGYLHNHTRMWFASIWIFTLRLPWQLGADFFYKHLLDADPASNTLSWRWVAGLHTPGKHYLARAENIARHTHGRFDPRGELDETAQPLPMDDWRRDPVPLPAAGLAQGEPLPEGPIALLLHDDDVAGHGLVPAVGIDRIAGLDSLIASAPSAVTTGFRNAALINGLELASAARQCGTHGVLKPGAVADWAEGCPVVLTPEAPEGMTAWALDSVRRDLAARGIRLVTIRRDWDRQFWPHARGGFFKLKDQIPKVLAGLAR